MSTFSRNGDIYRSVDGVAISHTLDAGTYSVSQDMQGFFLQRVGDMEVPEVMYGDIVDKCDRIVNTFMDRPSGVGVLLSGEKGSGKTLLAKLVSRRLREMGHPTIIISQPHLGDGFNALLKSITQPAMFFYDEFEKIYDDNNKQSMMLTVLDGFVEGKRLNVVTVNDMWSIHDMMRNRPGRFFYHMRYEGLEPEFIRDYCERNLKQQGVEDIVRFSSMFSKFNFDILKALVEEMNRYDEPLSSVIKYINADPGMDNRGLSYEVISKEVRLDPSKLKDVKTETFYNNNRSPLLYPCFYHFYDENYDSIETVDLTPDNIVALDGTRITYETPQLKLVIDLKKQVYGPDYGRFIL